MWTIFCTPVYVISVLGLLPATSMLRGPLLERLLDASLFIFLLALTTRAPGQKNQHNGVESFFWHILSVFIFTTSIFSFIRFEVDYFLVEYRQYFLMLAAIAFLRLTKRKFSVKKVLTFSYVYTTLLVLVFILNSYAGVQYRPGVFGESNYDLAAIAIIVCALLRSHKQLSVISILLIFLVASLSRTGMATFFVYAISRTRSLINAGMLTIVISMIAGLLLLRSDPFTSEDGAITIDRYIMAESYISEASSNINFAIFGQPLSHAKFDIDQMSYYRDSQPVSAKFGINTPSNFHGHVWRGFSLLGIPSYLCFLILVAASIRRNFKGNEKLFLYALIFISGFTQSIFSHPLVGTLLFAFILTGFANNKTIKPKDTRKQN